ncbi:hypothetical protein [Prevotella communis]|uniref:hypothetical protein n=1 Tax=Prevotella communis TaxID=2913614 RepID=UPI001EDB4636|nr:hypothetical protein L6464_00050 [Prevotella communis]
MPSSRQRDNIQAIVDNTRLSYFTRIPSSPTRRADDCSIGVSRVFFALTEADKTPEIGEIEKKVQPMLTDLQNRDCLQ